MSAPDWKEKCWPIRAMLHFDLLRLYAPAPIVQDAVAIPWYTTLSHVPMPEKPTSELLQLIIADLTCSKALQKDFDTRNEAKEDFSKLPFPFWYRSNILWNRKKRIQIRLLCYNSIAIARCLICEQQTAGA